MPRINVSVTMWSVSSTPRPPSSANAAVPGLLPEAALRQLDCFAIVGAHETRRAEQVGLTHRGKVIGLSKINRIVQFFARRPQVQERLTQQILLALQTLLGTRDVAISIKATHFCVKARGVMDSTSYTTTTSLGGVFKTQPDTRAEFLGGLKG